MQITIKDSFTTLNEYIDAERSSKFQAATIKKDETARAYYHFLNKPKITDYPIKMEFLWFVKGKRKDPDNICFAKKFIIDGMVKAGFIKNDNLNHIIGFTDDFFESDNEEVIIRINYAGTKENEVDGILNKIGTLIENLTTKKDNHSFKELEKYILSIEKHSKESNRIKVMRDYAVEILEEYRRI